ncbi:Ig-like domain repeat protein [Methanobrevibacter sp.]|uniref:Ig-like domain repeat protein n=1 Tax=Methanobrevibacter sp. TaxID=66852 RepID=UPI00388F0629
MLKIKYDNILVYFSLLLIFILSLSFVSATEDNSTISNDFISNDVDNVLGINQNEIYVNNSNSGYADGSYEAPYSNLNEAIIHAGDNSKIIIMDGRYTGASNTALTVDKNLTIEALSGNVVIDGENKYSFFNILNSYSLKLNDIKFVNGYCDVNSKNTAIITNNGDLTLNNISFNKMSSFMGLIFNNANLFVNDSEFKDISSSTLAQIIVNLGNATIANSNLPFRSVEKGITTTVYNYDSIQIINSAVGDLISNYDYSATGDRIFNVGIKNSKIHYIEQENGILYADNTNFTNGLRIHNSDVEFNRVDVFDFNQFSNPFLLSNSTLTAVSSIFNRGINSFSSKINVTYSVILDEITGNGGISEVYAPFNWWGDNNGPKIRYAITSADYWIIMLFENNNSPIPVGTTDPFVVSLNRYTDGKLIYKLDNVGLLPLRQVRFEAQNGKFLYSTGILSNGIFNNYLLDNTESSLVYAIIDSQRLRLVIGTGMTDYELYVSPTRGHNGYGDGSFESPYQTLDFTINKALNGNKIYLLNGTYSYGSNSNLLISKNLTIIGLENAVMSRDNGRNIFRIQSWGSLLIKNITFTVMSQDYGDSLFVVNGGKLAIENSTFTDIASSAIIDGSGIVKITNSSFYKNKGAIVTGNAKSYVDNILVEETSRYYTNQIYLNYNYLFPIDGSVEIYNSIFKRNKLGIVYLHPIMLLSVSLDELQAYSTYAYVENSTFIENTFKFNSQVYYSETYGFSIYESHGSFAGFINNSTFINNYGSIGKINSINSSIFIGNELAAINALDVNNSYFENNSNILKEGTAYKGDGLVNAETVINSTFISNRAAYGGALYNPKAVHYSVFVNNTAAYEGNDIFSYSGDVDYSSNWWGDNQKPGSEKVYLFLGNLKLDDWIIMELVNVTDDRVKVSLNSLIDVNENVHKLNYIINQRPVFLSCVNGIIQPLNSPLKNNILYANITSLGSSKDINVYARIDNQVLDLSLLNTSTKIIMENKVFYGGNNKYGFNLINVNGHKVSNQTLTVEIINSKGEIVTFDVVSDDNGYCEINFQYPVGLYTINVYYGGNGYFNPSNNTAQINVLASQTYLITQDKTYYGKNNNYNAILNDVNGYGIINRTIHFKIIDSNGNVKNVDANTNEFGRADLILNMDVGKYTVESIFDGDMWYLSSKSKSQIIIRPVNSTIDVPDVVFYGMGNVYNITLKDEHGTLIRGENIKVIISQGNLTDEFSLRTNNNGVAQLTINYLPGAYDVKAIYAGDNIYGSAVGKGLIKVEKVISVISGYHHVNIPLNGVYDVVLSDMYGRFIPNETITLNLYWGSLIKTLSQSTDGNGVATFVINENEGSYLATLDYAGNIWYEESTSAATIIVSNKTVIQDVSMNASDLAQYYGENKYFVISFNDPNAFSQYGKTIIATISSSKGIQSYNLLTDAFGKARLQIKLDPDIYNITYRYTNEYYKIFAEESNVIIVYDMPTSIYASDVIMKVGDKKYLEIYLKDVNNNPLTNMPVNVDINGTKYNLTTKNEGIARLLITNGVGNYLATFTMSNVNYISSKSSARVLVVDSDKTSTFLTAEDKTQFDNESVEFKVALMDLLDNPIAGANILINISTVSGNPVNTYQKITNNLGEAIFKLKLKYGDYLIASSYVGSQKYLESFTTNYLKILPSANLTKTILKGSFEENNTYKVILIDENANLLSNKQIVFKINNNSYSRVTDENGEASISLGYVAGIYNIQATFNGDNVYEKTGIADSTVISGNSTYLFVFDLVKYYRNGTQYYAQLLNSLGLPISDKLIIISINGTNYTNKTDKNGWASLKIDLHPGFYKVITYYLAENVTESAIKESTITVIPTIIGEDFIKYYRDSSQFKVQLLQGDGSPIVNKSISMNLSGVFYNVFTDGDGFAKLDIYSEPGVYNLTVQNPYDGLLRSFKITVLPYSTLKNSYFRGLLINDTYILSLVDDNDEGISSVNVFVKVNDNGYNLMTDSAGKIFINLGSDMGIFDIEAKFNGNGAFKGSDFNDTVIISGNLSYLFAYDVVKYYRNGTQFNALLVDALGNPLAGKKINLTLNGMDYTRITDSNGLITFSINLNPGVYKIYCAYSAENPLENAFAIANITVLPVIFGDNLVKYYKNDSQFYVKVIDGTGAPIVGKNVTMNINGVFYNRLTNNEGIAKLTINLLPGEYILTAYNPYGNFAQSYNITVLPTMMAADVVKYYMNDTQYYIQLTDGKGNPLSNQDVVMNINGVFYTRKTNDLGIARLNINLNPGEYILTAIHPNGLQISNKITVLPILAAQDLNMKYRDGSKFKALLLDGTGHPSVNKSVQFNINGVFYNRITDGKGFAYLNINLMQGKYIISSSYNGYTIANTITIN